MVAEPGCVVRRRSIETVITPTTRAALIFLACWCLAVAGILIAAPAVTIVAMIVGMGAWGVGMRASWNEGRAALARQPMTPSGQPRARVARAILLSWVLPGAGELLLGLPRRPAIALLLAFLVVAIPIWASLVPYIAALPFAVAVWLTGQARVRRLTGWGWTPLLPTWGEILGST